MARKSWASSPGTRASMLANRATNTKPESRLRSALHAAGLRFRKNYRIDVGSLRPRPDIVFTRAKLAVFVDGCFWHSCPVHGTTPRRNADYWKPKLEQNVARDKAVVEGLRSAGWTVLRIWEHTPIDEATLVVMRALGGPERLSEEGCPKQLNATRVTPGGAGRVAPGTDRSGSGAG